MHRKSAYLVFVAVLGLLVIGIIMLFSTSAFARESHGDVYAFVKRQGVWLVIGFCICVGTALIDYHLWQRTWWIWFGLALVALALCFVPHLGLRLNGSRRWIGIARIAFQPSEIAKIATIFFLAAWYSRFEKSRRELLHGFFYPLLIIAPLLGLILGEVDLGTTALIAATALVVMFVAGANPFLLGGICVSGFAGLLFVATRMSERM